MPALHALTHTYIVSLELQSLIKSEPHPQGQIVSGTAAWTFELEWMPGGEDPEGHVTLGSTPWWCSSPSILSTAEHTAPVPSEHGCTILPFRFYSPLTLANGEVKGWHCKTCGRLNAQRNFCFQKCAACAVCYIRTRFFSKLAHDVHVISYRPQMESYLSASTMYVQCAVSTPSRSPGTGTPSVFLARLALPLTTFASFATPFHPPRLCLYLLRHQETRKCVSSTSLRATGHLRKLNLRNSSERSRQTLSSSQSQ